jgi:NAD(P)-dependent dehydrogenase (short-subunit alcohol dehydrogenase family)
MDRIEGRTAFVTGAASGIGFAVASALLEAGARVVLADVNAELLAQVVPPLGDNAAAFSLDVTDRPRWTDSKRFTESRFGPVEILVCNAGIGPSGDELANMAPVVFDQIVAINLVGVLNGVATFAAGMRERRAGHIVTTASGAGLNPLPNFGAYVATKFAVVGMSESLRMEMAPYNVGVSVLCPSLVRTPLIDAGMKTLPNASEWKNSIESSIIEPAEAAALVLDGIRRNRSHIFTHGEFRKQVEARNAAILADFDGVPDRGVRVR